MFGDIGQLRTHFGTFEDITESYLVTETYDIRVVQRIQRVSKRCSSHLQASARRIRLTNNNNKTQLFANSVHDLTIVLACFHSKHLFVTHTYIEVSHSSCVESSEHHPISPYSTVRLKLSSRACTCTSYTDLHLHFPHLYTHTFSGLVLTLRYLRPFCAACQRDRCSVIWVGSYIQTGSYSC
jgi:hypothetical protein